METFEFLVTSIARVALKEHVKIQAENVITNNNLFHLKRKWNKLMIKEPSAHN